MCDSGIELCFFNSKVFFLTNSVDSENCQIKRKTRNTTSSEQFFRIHEKQKAKTKNTTSSEQFQIHEKQKNKNKKYHIVRTVPNSWKTKITTPSEQFQNHEKKNKKKQTPHQQNSSEIMEKKPPHRQNSSKYNRSL